MTWHYIRYWYDMNRYRVGRGGLDHMADSEELSEADFLERAHQAEIATQEQLQDSGLGQPPGRHIGDDDYSTCNILGCPEPAVYEHLCKVHLEESYEDRV